jgi:hypothetical protein
MLWDEPVRAADGLTGASYGKGAPETLSGDLDATQGGR